MLTWFWGCRTARLLAGDCSLSCCDWCWHYWQEEFPPQSPPIEIAAFKLLQTVCTVCVSKQEPACPQTPAAATWRCEGLDGERTSMWLLPLAAAAVLGSPVSVTDGTSPAVDLHLCCVLQLSSFHQTLSCNAFLVSGLSSWWFVDVCFLERHCNSVVYASHTVCISVPTVWGCSPDIKATLGVLKTIPCRKGSWWGACVTAITMVSVACSDRIRVLLITQIVFSSLPYRNISETER